MIDTAMARCLPIDASFSCKIRTTRVFIQSQLDVTGPQRILRSALPGRKLVKICSLGSNNTETLIAIGGREIRWIEGPPLDFLGYGLGRFESIDLWIDELVEVFAIAIPSLPLGESVDLRVMELA